MLAASPTPLPWQPRWSTVSPVMFANAIAAHDHMLFAYASGADIKIADVDFVTGAVAYSTSGQTIVASDVIDLVGANISGTGLTILGTNTHDIYFSAHV